MSPYVHVHSFVIILYFVAEIQLRLRCFLLSYFQRFDLRSVRQFVPESELW
jgi:hypothetical protein